MNREQAAAEISAAAGRVPGLELVRIAEVRGTYTAVFELQVSSSSSKGFATRYYGSISELLSTVLDTLKHINGVTDVNIFSSEMFEYLCAEMLPLDRPVSLTIKGVKEDTISGPRGEQVKVVLSFQERPKKMILNKTNARAIAKVLGPETNDWLGATVVLGVEQVKVGKNTLPSIRVKSATRAQKRQRGPAGAGQAGGPPPPDDQIGA